MKDEADDLIEYLCRLLRDDADELSSLDKRESGRGHGTFLRGRIEGLALAIAELEDKDPHTVLEGVGAPMERPNGRPFEWFRDFVEGISEEDA